MLAALIANLLLAQQPPSADSDKPAVSDNSFLVEEAYNQDAGVVQHISLFERSKRSGDWTYSFTEEWPVPKDARHQFSYTVAAVNTGTGAGFGDTALNWRYQLVSNARVAIAPRVSVSLPTGNIDRSYSAGTAAWDINLPVSISTRHVTVHLNAGTFVGMTQPSVGDRIAQFRIAQGLIFLPRGQVNLMVEAVTVRRRFAAAEWATTTVVSPGIRWAHSVGSLQIVPGVAVPVVVHSDAASGEPAAWGLIGYLSLEHPFGRRP